MTAIAHDHVAARGREIVVAAEGSGLAVRMVGGAGVWAALVPARRPAYERVRPVPRDLDLLLPAKSGKAAERLFSSMGFEGDERLNAWRGEQRQRWFASADGVGALEIDVFVGKPPLCHPIEFDPRRGAGPQMQATDLLLQKLQIVEINEKDLIDAAFLLLDRELSSDSDDEEALLVPRIVELVAKDWGFYHTATTNLTILVEAAPRFLSTPDLEAVGSAVEALRSEIETAPKSVRWRMRAKVGTKAPWYEEVEEVDR